MAPEPTAAFTGSLTSAAASAAAEAPRKCMRHAAFDPGAETAVLIRPGFAQRTRLALLVEPSLGLGLRPAAVVALTVPTVSAMLPNLAVAAGVNVVRLSTPRKARAAFRPGRP